MPLPCSHSSHSRLKRRSMIDAQTVSRLKRPSQDVSAKRHRLPQAPGGHFVSRIIHGIEQIPMPVSFSCALSGICCPAASALLPLRGRCAQPLFFVCLRAALCRAICCPAASALLPLRGRCAQPVLFVCAALCRAICCSYPAASVRRVWPSCVTRLFRIPN